MAIQRLNINDFLPASEGKLLLDVRSPGEFHHAHIPSAIGLPLFTDEERKEVGTSYKQESREKAIRIGLDFFGPKMRPIVEKVETLAEERNTKEIFIYCWRGGMRSGAVAWLLDLYGFKVHVLNGGYKSFRNYVLETFSMPWPFKIIGGYTGSGKTEILQELEQMGESVIDLETIASHKGSAFGNINMPEQPSQEMFENILAPQLRSKKDKAVIWMEDESQRIGLINLPNDLWATMRNAPVLFFDIPFEKRLEHIVEEYGCLDRDRLIGAIQRISKRLGGLDTKNALMHIEAGNIYDCFYILLKYYDKHYYKGLQSRTNWQSLLTNIPAENVTKANAALLIPIPV